MSVRRRASGRAHYNYFRDYDPAVGRYVESDPIGLEAGVNTFAYVNGNPLSRFDSLGLCEDKEKEKECENKLSDMLLAIFGRRLDGTSGPKGMAQRYKQMGRQLPADVRRGYEEEFGNRQRNLRKRVKDYVDSGCGDPPLSVVEWMNKPIPEPPPPQNEEGMSTAEKTLLFLLISEGLRVIFPPRNLVPVM